MGPKGNRKDQHGAKRVSKGTQIATKMHPNIDIGKSIEN